MNYLVNNARQDEETRLVLQAAIESANDSILITELNLEAPGPRIEYVNPAFTRMTGYSEADVIGKTPRILQGPKTDRGLLDRLRADLITGQSFHGQTVNYRKDGGEYVVEWRITPVRNRHGITVKWLAVQRDVTERVRAEERLQMLNRDLEQFVYSASHDLQEPVRNVAIYSQLLAARFRHELSPEAMKYFHYVTEGSKRVGDLIEGLLAYTQVSSEGYMLPFEHTDANEALGFACDNLERAIQEAGATVTHDELPRVEMRYIHLVQIFQNLISNAIKYRRQETPAVIHVSAQPKGQEIVRFAVQDNGIGIERRYYQQVFGVFRRLHDRSYAGTGIGLAITQRVIERYGQSIWIESELGEGTTFFFTAKLHHGEQLSRSGVT